jgi:hypothetical protein
VKYRVELGVDRRAAHPSGANALTIAHRLNRLGRQLLAASLREPDAIDVTRRG